MESSGIRLQTVPRNHLDRGDQMKAHVNDDATVSLYVTTNVHCILLLVTSNTSLSLSSLSLSLQTRKKFLLVLLQSFVFVFFCNNYSAPPYKNRNLVNYPDSRLKIL